MKIKYIYKELKLISYKMLEFDKDKLGNLEYALKREVLSTNRAGGYMSTTVICCNTRKYHGLMICPVDTMGGENHVLLSSVDETVVQHDTSFNLAIHRFPQTYEPRGHKYIIHFDSARVPTITYRVGGVILTKELLWLYSKEQLLIRYTLLEAKSPTKLRLRPFLAFRQVHTLSKANLFANTRSYRIDGGVKNQLYEGFPWLKMQLNVENEFIEAPDWYYNFEYTRERERGYPYLEDLLTTGYFEFDMEKGQRVILSCSTEQFERGEFEDLFNEELAKRSGKDGFLPCLRHSARQFIVKKNGKTEIVAGYPWFGRWGRDTFISLPGITLATGDVEDCKDVIDTMVSQMKDGLFPNMGNAYNSVDAPMWFFWTLQQLAQYTSPKEVWNAYGKPMKAILEAYRTGIGESIRVDDNGLVRASQPGHALTWMDAVVDGEPVTGRDGYQVEINALWYNAVCYTLELARKFRDKDFVTDWQELPDKIKQHFVEKFWLADEGYLADYVGDEGVNRFIRPNQIIACAMDYSMLSDKQKQSVTAVVTKYLLTPKGLRTLSPANPSYRGHYGGSQPERDRAYHQGTVWPWLLEHYVKANFDLMGAQYLPRAKDILAGFEEDITAYGIGTIPELYDGDPPFEPGGAISQAWSVGALLRINEMIEKYSK